MIKAGIRFHGFKMPQALLLAEQDRELAKSFIQLAVERCEIAKARATIAAGIVVERARKR
jgi:hypothetical protein